VGLEPGGDGGRIFGESAKAVAELAGSEPLVEGRRRGGVGVAEELLESLLAGGGTRKGEDEAVQREVGGDRALVILREGEGMDGAGEGGAVGLVDDGRGLNLRDGLSGE
jgi:hypothetical protein